MFNHNYYLHFVTDLRRAAFCLTNNNIEGVKTFLQHADDIITQKLDKNTVNEDLDMDFNTAWTSLFSTNFSSVSKEQYAEEILTLSSLVFNRITHKELTHMQNITDGPVSAGRTELSRVDIKKDNTQPAIVVNTEATIKTS